MLLVLVNSLTSIVLGFVADITSKNLHSPSLSKYRILLWKNRFPEILYTELGSAFMKSIYQKFRTTGLLFLVWGIMWHTWLSILWVCGGTSSLRSLKCSAPFVWTIKLKNLQLWASIPEIHKNQRTSRCLSKRRSGPPSLVRLLISDHSINIIPLAAIHYSLSKLMGNNQ